MKLGRIIAAAATSGLLLSGAFVVAEEYTGHNVFAVSLDNGSKVEIKAKKGTVREVLIANDIPFGADDRVEPGLDTKVNGGETINIYKAHEITIVDGDTTTVRKTTYKKVGDILKELNITLGENDRVTPDLNKEVATVDTIKIVRDGKATEVKKEEIKEEENKIIERDGAWLVDGLLNVDEFKEFFHIDQELPGEEDDLYKTMGGLLNVLFGRIPKELDKAKWDGYTFEVIDMDHTRIDKILVTYEEPIVEQEEEK